MLALIAGTGDLPKAVMQQLAGEDVIVCAMTPFVPDLAPDLTFRIETLGSFLIALRQKGVTDVCFAGAIQRPDIDPAMIDAATLPLIATIKGAIAMGDDGALRAVIAVFEAAGFTVRAAQAIAPDLLPTAGVKTRARPDAAIMRAAVLGERVIAKLGAKDIGQACIVRDLDLLATEGVAGTDAMMTSAEARGGVLVKGPKPGQDRRADLPVIGPDTARRAVQIGLSGIVIAAGGVMVLDVDTVVRVLDDAGLVLWVRPETEGAP